MNNETYLYHGSTTQHIKTLEPRERYTPQGKIDYSAIYATPLPAYAAAHSFAWSTDEGVDLQVRDNQVFLTVPQSFKERIQVPVSIYKISANGFTHTAEETTGYTWHTTSPVEILEEVQYPSVEVALKELGVVVGFV